MSKFAKFMKANKVVKENEKYAATNSLCDESGKPLLWEFRHISSKENEELRESCMKEVQVTGKPGIYRQKFKSSDYIKKMIAASVVYPDLYDAELQDSYEVQTPEDLLLALVDDPGEYSELMSYVQKFQGFDISFSDKVDEAKN
jgi:hypothetical protein